MMKPGEAGQEVKGVGNLQGKVKATKKEKDTRKRVNLFLIPRSQY